MDITSTVTQASVGKEILLSTQELIALKDKWEEIRYIFEEHGEGRLKEVRKKYNGLEAMNILSPLCEQMHNFIDKITEGVQSTSEVHDALFKSEREIELENAQVEH